MNLSVFWAVPFAIQCHVIAALTALSLSPVIYLSSKGTVRHRWLGRIWALSMGVTAISSFWIHGFNLVAGYSPIHLLSLFTLYSVGAGVLAARRGKTKAHQGHMLGAMLGLVVAGLLTTVPGRLMSRMLFDGAPWVGFGVLCMLGALFALSQRRRGV